MLNFTALADLPPHVTQRSRKQMGMEKELTAEELIKAFNDGTYWQPGYVPKNPRKPKVYPPVLPDGVDERVEQAKRSVDFSACHRANIPCLSTREDMLTEGTEFELEGNVVETLQSMQISLKHPICSDRRFTAMMLNADPHMITWNRVVERMPRSEFYAMIRRCQARPVPEYAWNDEVSALEPNQPSPRRIGTCSILHEPWRPQHGSGGMGFLAKPSDNQVVEEWMEKAENHELDGVITRCQFSGESLVEVRKGLRRTWRIAPNWQGMGLKKAREAVSWAAIQAGVAEGYQVGEPPDVVKALVMDGCAWAGLAVATRHPVFYDTGRFLLMMQNLLYFKLEDTDMRNNARAWARIAAAAAKEEANE